MKKELKNKIKSDLLKSGFGAEMNTINHFLSKGWNASGSEIYFDRDEKITRSIDVMASKLLKKSKGKQNIFFEYHLQIEVKKSERPWVVFKREIDLNSYSEGWANPNVVNKLPFKESYLAKILDSTSLPKKIGWIAYGIHESFKSPNQPSRWYKAFVTSCKASFCYTKRECFTNNLFEELKFTFLLFSNPVVVLDGLLITAELDENNEIKLKEEKYAPFRFDFGTSNYERQEYRIDLVTINGLVDYINYNNSRCDNIFKEFK